MAVLMDVSKYRFDNEKFAKLHKYRNNQPGLQLKVRFITLLVPAN